MTFDEYWSTLCLRNPGLSKPGMRLTLEVDEFQRVLQLAYDAGLEHTGDTPVETPEFLRDLLFGGCRK